MTDQPRITTVNIGRSTWQGYENEAPRRADPNQTVGSFANTDTVDAKELIDMIEEAYRKL